MKKNGIRTAGNRGTRGPGDSSKRMKILKFGGTSVGSAERMLALVKLIEGGGPKIVVLSAMSGTTNALVEIAEALYAKEKDRAAGLAAALEKKYAAVAAELYAGKKAGEKAGRLLASRFGQLRSLAAGKFTGKKEREVLALGELLSTALFHYLLEEKGVDSVLLPALEFMRIDKNEEPDMGYIEAKAGSELAKHPGKS